MEPGGAWWPREPGAGSLPAAVWAIRAGVTQPAQKMTPPPVPRLEGKVVLTGASGFIGGRLREELTQGGAEVVTVRRKASKPGAGKSVELEYDDLAGLERLFEAERPDYVLHVAGATKGVSYDDFRRANVMPTENLLQALAAKHPQVKRFVYVSSLIAFGPSTLDKPHDESVERKPVEFYGKSKAEAEQVVESYAGKLPWTIVRPSGVYGPGDVDFFNYFREASSGRNVFFGNRQRWFSLVYVDDLIDAIFRAAAHPAAVGKGYMIGDEHLNWEQFQAHIVKHAGRKVFDLDLPAFLVGVAAFFGELATKVDKKPRLFNRNKAKLNDYEAWTCTSARARAELGWEPKVFAPEGVERTFRWYRENKWL